MTRTRSSTLLILAAALACATPVFADELVTGVDSNDISSVKYLAGTAANKRSGKRIKDGLGSRLEGGTKIRRVTFDLEDELSGETFSVRGVLYGWKNLRVARYQFADLREATLFTNHDREDESVARLIEVRGRQALVISGEGMDDAALVAEVRKLAWPRNAQKRIDGLGVQESSDDLFFSFSDEALAATPTLQARFDEQEGMLTMLANMDPSATLTTSGDTKRLETGGSVFTLSPRAMGLYSSAASEQSFGDLLSELDFAPAATASSGGLSGALGGATGNVPAVLGASHDGETFNVKVGDEISIELAGNPTTGYRWRQRGSLTKLTEVDSDFHGGGAGGPVGSGGTFSFVFRADAKGKQTLRLVYSRGSGTPAETFSVTIVVK